MQQFDGAANTAVSAISLQCVRHHNVCVQELELWSYNNTVSTLMEICGMFLMLWVELLSQMR